jgi:hypothetical protein
MALALIVTLQSPLPAAMATYEKSKTGKALVRESDRLGSAARRKGVEPLTAMLSEDPKILIEQLRADGFDPTKMRIPPELWHPASDGLKTVRALTAYVTENLNDFKQPNPILRDLKAVQDLLIAAEAAGIHFHFANAER